eukprot:TRINITY_DN1066_c0_g1_i1.p2 TRINITY_DN1066_c0_g1~~TRINITY_DN1066_c0_g1_i1.p2  ORF type:complete len:150 (+),score=62.02 TRINITY_DN1066_c0_g1_i1:1-450(+)
MPLAWENPEAVEEALGEINRPDNTSGWLLVAYTGPDSVALTAKGSGSVDEFLPFLKDDEMQYVLMRVGGIAKDAKNKNEKVTGTRDVFIAWVGPEVGIIEKGKKKSHLGDLKAVLKPFHAELLATGKKEFTEETVKDRSAGLSGSHEIE